MKLLAVVAVVQFPGTQIFLEKVGKVLNLAGKVKSQRGGLEPREEVGKYLEGANSPDMEYRPTPRPDILVAPTDKDIKQLLVQIRKEIEAMIGHVTQDMMVTF